MQKFKKLICAALAGCLLVPLASCGTEKADVSDIFDSNEKISYWKNRLNGISFVAPHASFIANLDYSVQHTRTQLILAKKDLNGEILNLYRIPISAKNQAEIKRAFFYVLERR